MLFSNLAKLKNGIWREKKVFIHIYRKICTLRFLKFLMQINHGSILKHLLVNISIHPRVTCKYFVFPFYCGEQGVRRAISNISVHSVWWLRFNHRVCFGIPTFRPSMVVPLIFIITNSWWSHHFYRVVGNHCHFSLTIYTYNFSEFQSSN